MRWEAGRRSENVEDRRGFGGSGLKIGGGLAVIVTLLGALFGVDLTPLVQLLSGQGSEPTAPTHPNEPRYPHGQKGVTNSNGAAKDRSADFVSVILADTEDTWTALFRDMHREYVKPKLVLFTDVVQSACGTASSAVGPFYCQGDQKVYIDLSFYRELQTKFGAPGDFAQAYVIAHEIGHHVQTLLGTAARLWLHERSLSASERNALSVKQELQADCYAGVWGHHADSQRQLLEAGDIDEALRAAAAVGDDRLQKQAGRVVTPETFTHGSSEQRAYWFKVGMSRGAVQACDTFAGTVELPH
ncbi:MAG TPA: neutral zinc metallopeptidase [Polyangiaceae bacterium]